MATPALFETMSRQVEAECSEHLAAARAEADRILADARTKARTLRDDVLAAANAETERLGALWKQKAESESTRLELAMKNDAVEAVLADVARRVREIASGPDFGAVLERLLTELMGAVGPGENVEVLAPEAHADHVRGLLERSGRKGMKVVGSREFWDGVAVQDAGRTYRISNTLTGRFERVERAARKHCMKVLFGQEGGA